MPIETIFIAMMENRSFDHLLGYLSLEGHEMEGQRADAAWREGVSNPHLGQVYRPFALDDPYSAIKADPPHGRDAIATQIGKPDGGRYPMKGFVDSYAEAKALAGGPVGNHPPVMGYFSAEQAPVIDFLARNFAVCDHWHAALPAGTQPNRLMAMSGYSRIDTNRVPMPHHNLVYDWLTHHKIPWRVYHSGIPFFALMLDRLDDMLDHDRFRPFGQLFNDLQDEPPGDFPRVVFLEPVYADAPHIGVSNDDHAPGGIRGGQEFLLDIYRSITRVPAVWERSLLIVTYDEHGGFFDHVSPPVVHTAPPADAFYQQSFESLGVRVPAILVSPFVSPGSVCHDVMDHTSILKFLGEMFGDGSGYSPEVDARAVHSLSRALDNPAGGHPAPVIASLQDYIDRAPQAAGRLPGTQPDTEIQQGFQRALDQIRDHPARPAGTYDALLAAFPREIA